MRTHALQLALQTNKHDNQETMQVILLVHLSGDILNDANCAAKGYPFIGSPLGPSVQSNAPQSGDVGSSGGAEDLDTMDLPSQDPANCRLDDPTHLNPNASELPPGDIEDLWLQDTIHLKDLKTTADFVKSLQGATLDDPNLGMSDEAIHCLHNPPHEQPPVVSNKYTRLAIDLFLINPSDITYEENRAAILRCSPDADIPSYYKIKRLVTDLTGIDSVVHHMCVNSCIAYTGPFLDLQVCPICSEPRYDQFRLRTSPGSERVPYQEFHTILIGPQLQALYRSQESASWAHYLCEERSRVLEHLEHHDWLDEYSDVLHGTDLIMAFQDGRINQDDIVLMFSIDGAQLYAMKASACWIYIWVLLNLSPAQRYKKSHILIGSFIPGPNNPKNIDSFLFPGLQHLVALQREGLHIWDAALQREVVSKVFLALITADGPGMMHITGLVGYHGKHGCRLYCGMRGCRMLPALRSPARSDLPRLM